MRILSWNAAGVSRWYAEAKHRPEKDGFAGFLNSLGADIICVQEAKIARAKLSAAEAVVPGYESFWCLNKTTGYSGVVTYVKEGSYSPIDAAAHVFGVAEFDDEGRCIVTDHGSFVVFNAYCPMAGDQDADRPRLAFKLRFHDALLAAMLKVRACGKHVILAGDLNIAYEARDVFPLRAKQPCHSYSEGELAWFRRVLLPPPAPLADAGIDLSLTSCDVQGFAPEAAATSVATSDGAAAAGAATSSGPFAGAGTATFALNLVNGADTAAASLISLDDDAAACSPHLVDCWRHDHPAAEQCFTAWDWKTLGREKGEGVRIDFILPDVAFHARYCLRNDCSSKTAASISTGLPACLPPIIEDYVSVLSRPLPPGSAIVMTPTKMSDHVAVLVVTATDPPGTPLGHPPCSLSSRVLFKPERSAMDMFKSGSKRALPPSTSAAAPSTLDAAAAAKTTSAVVALSASASVTVFKEGGAGSAMLMSSSSTSSNIRRSANMISSDCVSIGLERVLCGGVVSASSGKASATAVAGGSMFRASTAAVQASTSATTSSGIVSAGSGAAALEMPSTQIAVAKKPKGASGASIKSWFS